jgi:hypothetical protein
MANPNYQRVNPLHEAWRQLGKEKTPITREVYVKRALELGATKENAEKYFDNNSIMPINQK